MEKETVKVFTEEEKFNIFRTAMVTYGLVMEMGGGVDKANSALIKLLGESGLDITKPFETVIVEPLDNRSSKMVQFKYDPEKFGRSEYPFTQSVRIIHDSL